MRHMYKVREALECVSGIRRLMPSFKFHIYDRHAAYAPPLTSMYYNLGLNLTLKFCMKLAVYHTQLLLITRGY